MGTIAFRDFLTKKATEQNHPERKQWREEWNDTRFLAAVHRRDARQQAARRSSRFPEMPLEIKLGRHRSTAL